LHIGTAGRSLEARLVQIGSGVNSVTAMTTLTTLT
jgi:hypothetical protein